MAIDISMIEMPKKKRERAGAEKEMEMMDEESPEAEIELPVEEIGLESTPEEAGELASYSDDELLEEIKKRGLI